MSQHDRYMSSRELLNRIGLREDTPSLLLDEDLDTFDKAIQQTSEPAGRLIRMPPFRGHSLTPNGPTCLRPFWHWRHRVYPILSHKPSLCGLTTIPANL